ncbi:phage holin family protein [Thermomonospora umbrina]|uniref:Putative membrane protein n=1 Tax=Thermomonospora umbrina TaxID=111806 RepID=A0A3D9SXH3_9ACTN|nr:phage holin family protein [Thermomonospora umbrina]REE99210.1 putative membrane protein [Thermomonospora umbrina]
MGLLIRVLTTGVALWVAAAVLDGVDVRASTRAGEVGTLAVVAVIFGLVNLLIKPVIKVLGCAFYILTFGLFALVVNAALLMLTSWAAGELDLPFHVEWFWPAFWGAIIVGVVSWLLNAVLAGED